MIKNKITRTYGPIHFEDLDPHRFEDLIRELIYDYKDWLTIEATGRAGNDKGFDIRAYEKTYKTPVLESEDENLEEIYQMAGNLWMIQCKREKEIGPKRVKKILLDIDSKNPPYGYILAAPVNFSKQSYDVFREELQKKGVMEFYLWGKAELENMLHLPKNDRILFTFFGFSLVSKRRSRATEIRQVVTNKNKLYRILGDGIEFRNNSVLFRDLKDTKYPYKNEYKDFKERPRWFEYKIVAHHPLGLIVNTHRFFAYVDTEKKEYDFTDTINLISRESDSQEERVKHQEIREIVEDYWDHLPRRNQATFIRNGLVRYDEMLVIDDKGDELHKFPHIFIDFDSYTGPFAGFYECLEKRNNSQLSTKGYKRVKKFPTSFSVPVIGKIHDKNCITLNDQEFSMVKRGDENFYALYDVDGRYNFLSPRDFVKIENQDQNNNSFKYYLQITHVESMKVKDYLRLNPESKFMIEKQLGKKPSPEETLNIHEFKITYDFIVDRKRNKND